MNNLHACEYHKLSNHLKIHLYNYPTSNTYLFLYGLYTDIELHNKITTMQPTENRALANAQRAKSILLIFYILAGLLLTTIIISMTILKMPNYLDFAANQERGTYLLMYGLPLLVSGLRISIFIIAVIFFIMWSRRAYANLERMGSDIIFQEGWASAAWFIPFLNLVRPYNIMVEIWEDYQRLLAKILDQPEGDFYSQPTTKLGAWWTLWIISNVLSNLSNLNSIADNFNLAVNIGIIAEIFLLISLALLVMIIRQVSTWEQEVQAAYSIMNIEGFSESEENTF